MATKKPTTKKAGCCGGKGGKCKKGGKNGL